MNEAERVKHAVLSRGVKGYTFRPVKAGRWWAATGGS